MKDFTAPGQSELRLAYHACTSLFSLRDWVFETHKSKPWTFRGVPYGPIVSKGKFHDDLCKVESDFGIISDLANATKHMILDPDRRNTNLHGVANVHIQISGSRSGAEPLSDEPSTSVYVHIDTTHYPVQKLATKVHKMWTELFAENVW